MKIINILQKILKEQTVEPAAQDVTSTKYINDILKSLANREFTPDTSMDKIIKI